MPESYYVSQEALIRFMDNASVLKTLHPDEPETRAREYESLIVGFVNTITANPVGGR